MVGAGSGCAEPTGTMGATLLVTAATAGIDPDADGYSVVVDDQDGRPIARNATLTMADLEPGEHRVALNGRAPNCTVEGANPRTIDLRAGGTVTVRFYVTCAAATGALAVHTLTTGDGRDPDGYVAIIDGQLSRQLAPNGDQTISGLAPGEHRVVLTDVITNCRLDGGAARTVSMQAGQTADLLVSVACVARSLHLTATTTGRAPDPDGYAVVVDSGVPQPIGVVGSLEVGGLVDGEHVVRLSGLAAYCETEKNPRTVQVSESTLTVDFQVACPGPPTGGRLLLNGAAGSEVHIFAVRPGGSGEVDLTPDADGFAGRWSPDRSRIVFETTRSGRSEVFVMNADGTHRTRLAAGHSPAWSPDGGRIAFISGGGLIIMYVDGSDRRALPTGREPDSPSWSPDGRVIAFTQLNVGRCGLIVFDVHCARDIHVLNVDGSGDRAVTQAQGAAAFDSDPVWSPDGRTIAFWRAAFGRFGGDLYLVAPDGTGLVQLTATADVDEGFPVWSPDGRALAFARRTRTTAFDLALIPREGGASLPLLSRPGEQLPTSWR
jgi:TolB protein